MYIIFFITPYLLTVFKIARSSKPTEQSSYERKVIEAESTGLTRFFTRFSAHIRAFSLVFLWPSEIW